MKRECRLLIAGTAFAVLAGMVPASAQDATKTEPEKAPSTSTTAQQPAAEHPIKSEASADQQRLEINKMAKESIDFLNAKSPEAKTLYSKAYGYAVFDNFKMAFLITGGGGKGVAMPKAGSPRTYMKMGTAGVGVGLGAHKYQVVFLFETKERFDKFVNEGWTAEASANAVADKSGANAEVGFQDGIAYYQLTEAGLMLQADISGTKYWKDDELNMKEDKTD